MNTIPQRVDLPLLLTGPLRLDPALDRHLGPAIARHLGLPDPAVVGYKILHRSLDARQKGRLRLDYRLIAQIDSQAAGTTTLTPSPDEPDPFLEADFIPRQKPTQPIVVGTGPAGLFAAWLLARHGCNPLILERGPTVEERALAIQNLREQHTIDPEANYLYGEGGAGTYSDGKLYTRLRDPRVRLVVALLVKNNAGARIAYDAHPHIGSDVLPHVVACLRQEIIALGGTFAFKHQVKELLVSDGRCRGVVLADGARVESEQTILAIGHSARDLIRRIVAQGVACQARPWQVGVRIEHPQVLINRRLLGADEVPALGAASYQISHRPEGELPGITSFCMCPGGELLPCSTADGFLCTNGGSRYRRDSGYANAALIGSVAAPETSDPLASLAALETLERRAWESGGTAWSAPAQRAADFLGRKTGTLAPSTWPFALTASRIDTLLPPLLAQGIARALASFDKRIPGFIAQGQFVGLETRISLPLRFQRDPATLESTLPGLRLAGEGAGAAGGIVSAAIDGLKQAEMLLHRDRCDLP